MIGMDYLLYFLLIDKTNLYLIVYIILGELFILTKKPLKISPTFEVTSESFEVKICELALLSFSFDGVIWLGVDYNSRDFHEFIEKRWGLDYSLVPQIITKCRIEADKISYPV